jgi:formylglycine-generating enzyme required for sulfatase activity
MLVVTAMLWLSWDRLRPRWLLWWDFKPLELNAQGHMEYLHERSGVVFVLLPGGEYLMGTTEEEQRSVLTKEADTVAGKQQQLERALASEGPRHRVFLSPFLIAKYEVTRSQWARVMGAEAAPPGSMELPRSRISWFDCQEFCRRVSLSLPTEAQWEYACRAGTPGPFAGTGSLADMGWSGEDLELRTPHLGGEKRPNAFGLFDMHGNLEEWCRDAFDDRFYSSGGEGAVDPVCRQPSKYRVARGGSLRMVGLCCRSGRRGWLEPGSKANDLGFRPVFNLRTSAQD